MPRNMIPALILALFLVGLCHSGELEDQVSQYGRENAIGYLRPLIDAIGTDLNGGLHHSARIPTIGFYASIELPVVCVLFGSDDRTFMATTEGYFSPKDTVEVPTVVGAGDAVTVTGDAGTKYQFPGGFDLSSFALVVPQVRFGSVLGTEGLVRYFALDAGDNEFGKISLFGVGLRHNLSQYLVFVPLDVSAGFFWQRLSLGKSQSGKDLVEGTAVAMGIQASRRFGAKLAFVEPYSGFAIDRFSMDVSYENADLEEVLDVDFGTTTSARFTMGVGVRLAVLKAYADYSISKQRSFSIGLGLGM